MKCNICRLPGKVTYTFIHPESHKQVTETRSIGCLGHWHLHPSKWNLHPDYPKFERLRREQQANAYLSLKPKK